MKIFTFRYSNEALVVAVAALLLFSAVATVTLVFQMAQAADIVDCRAVATASNVSATPIRGLL